jgi:nucleoside-diphosphate-sugar epimerase
MIGRAFLRQNPFEVWGDGNQIRNWTYVGDIVRGLALVAEKIDDATAVNLGTEEPVRVIDAARMVLDYTGHEAVIRLRPDMPTGPLNRVASHALARERLGWEPRVRFADGLRRTVEWYFATKEQQRAALAQAFDTLLVER